MPISRRTLVRAALAASLLVSAVLPATADAQIWIGTAHGFRVTWTERDVTARPVSGRGPVLSLRKVQEDTWGTPDFEEGDLAEAPDEVRVTYRVLSVAGPLLAVEETTWCDCGGAHPISWAGFTTYDLRRSTADSLAQASLTDFFPAEDVRAALARDPLVARVLAAKGAAPRTLDGLLSALELEEIEGPDECTYSAGPEVLRQFALHHLEGGRVAVRISLGHHVELCRGKYIQLGILLPVPPSLRADLEAASARRAGFLMQHARAVARGRQTRMVFGPKKQ